MRLLLALLLLSLAMPAIAEVRKFGDWRVWTHDDGAFIMGSASLGELGSGFGFGCGQRSRHGVSPLVTGNVEPLTTPPGQIRLSLTQDVAGGIDLKRKDFVFVIDGLGYQLPETPWDDFWGGYELNLAINDPLIGAIRASDAIELRSAKTQPKRFAAKDANAAFGHLLAFCQTGAPAPQPEARSLVEVPATAPLAPVQSAATGQEALQAEAARLITERCNGPALQPVPLAAGDVDRDGTPDILLDFNDVECPGTLRRPFCGAANCSVILFLSSKGPRFDPSFEFLGVGSDLIANPNGGVDLSLGGTVATCTEATRGTSCQHVWTWNGREMVKRP